MRLTLRTLLAYLDKTLTPGEATFLEQKIKQAKVANVLVDRISAVIVTPNLPPLRIDAQGTAGDANTVAEYLDNTLDPNVVVDFEQACLSDDARLAEVAACHQILSSAMSDTESVPLELTRSVKAALNTKVLGKAAGQSSEKTNTLRLDPSSAITRNLPDSPNSDYSLSADTEMPAADNDQTFTSQSYQEKPIRGIDLSDATVPHVPDYLRSHSSGKWLSALSTVALVAALIALGWLSLGSIEGVQQLFLSPDRIADAVSEPPANPNLPAQSAPPPIPNVNTTKNNERAEPAAVDPPKSASTNSTVIQNDGLKDPLNTQPSTENIELENSQASVGKPSVPSIDLVVPEPTAPIENSISTVDDLARAMDPPESDRPPAVSSNSTYASTVIWRPETKAAANAIVLASKPSSETQNRLHLVSAGDGMLPLDNWIIPTACRTEFWLEPGIRWKATDLSDLAIGKSIVADTAVLRLRIGRALVAATPSCKDLILETAENDISKIQFNDANGVIAIELRYKPQPGLKLAQSIDEDGSIIGMMRPVISITGVVGTASIKKGINAEEQISIGEMITWDDDFPPERKPLEAMPWWFKNPSLRPIDLEASQSLQPLLKEWTSNNAEPLDTKPRNINAADEPSPAQDGTSDDSIASRDRNIPPLTLNSFLLSQTSKRSTAPTALAGQILILNGEYSQLAGTSGLLSDPNFKAHRSMILDALEQSLGADPSREILLQDAILEADPARAATILRLLSLPSDQQLEEGEDRILIDAISSPFLDERVLGIHQLSRIMGRDLGYQSDRPSSESIQAWKKLLNAKKIRWPKPKV